METNKYFYSEDYDFRNYTEKKVIGKGTYGIVKLIQLDSGEVFAKKTCPVRTDSTFILESTLNEIDKLQILRNHNACITLYGLEYDENEISLFLELMNCDISDLYLNWSIEERIIESRRIIEQISPGLITMKEFGIIHMDIKPTNILYKNGEYKLTDFGLSCINEKFVMNKFIGTYNYMPPELLKNVDVRYPESIDVWSLGMTILTLLSGEILFDYDGKDEILMDIWRNSTYKKDFSHFKRDSQREGHLIIENFVSCDLPPDLKYILEHMLDLNPETRFIFSGKNNLDTSSYPIEYEMRRYKDVLDENDIFVSLVNLELIARVLDATSGRDSKYREKLLSCIPQIVNAYFAPDDQDYTFDLDTWYLETLSIIEFKIFNPHLHSTFKYINSISPLAKKRLIKGGVKNKQLARLFK